MPYEPIYETKESHREKHRGDAEAARIEEDDDGCPLGKCSNEIDPALAQKLLATGIQWSPSTSRSPYPHSVFNTYKGVPYRAHRRGQTRYYHGFPDVKNRIPRAVRDELRQRAVKEGAEETFDRWMQQTEKYT